MERSKDQLMIWIKESLEELKKEKQGEHLGSNGNVAAATIK
jgi:hypothetical protein